MRILIGHFSHESNSFNPKPTRQEDFDFYEGEASLDKFYGVEVLREQGCEIVPTIYAGRWSSGIVEEKAYHFFANKILEVVEREKGKIDGIWLQLHGAMHVENIVSGEYRLLSDIRAIVGDALPIGLSMDMHANNRSEIAGLVNVMRGYRTAPHVDMKETQCAVVKALLDYIRNGENFHPVLERVPMILVGEKALSAEEPLKSIIARLEALEAREEIAVATMFVCMAWSDTPHTTTTVAITPSGAKHADYAGKCAREIAGYIYSRRADFKFGVPAFTPEQAVDEALCLRPGPVFISDSGDNPTAGGTGVNTTMLDILLRKDLKDTKVLLASICDDRAYHALARCQAGDGVCIPVGLHLDENSRPVKVEGRILQFGEIFAKQMKTYIKKANLVLVRCDRVDICITDQPLSFTGKECFESARIRPEEYDIVVVKQGYLFPDLAETASHSILALTLGCTGLQIRQEDYKRLPRPIYPLDEA